MHFVHDPAISLSSPFKDSDLYTVNKNLISRYAHLEANSLRSTSDAHTEKKWIYLPDLWIVNSFLFHLSL